MTLTTALLLAPQRALALDFNFFFSDSTGGSVSGIIKGLEEGFNSPGSVEVLNSSIGSTGSFLRIGTGGFTVASGAITSANWLGLGSSTGLTHDPAGSTATIAWLAFANSPTSSSLNIIQGGFRNVSRATVAGLPTYLQTPAPAPATSSVPGPLPIVGAAAAFGFSRRLRKRIQASELTISSQPTP
ncbi:MULTISPECIES: hypothetical protein [unclassified Cyanobium]|uniref:hypothetical protein n=1 Tax=unclassified Cyanobium TaxID=2627006 RepID=UPI0020CD71DD|nr:MULTISPECIES: hypothetical protein [unclassified Cyanobium]MCP9834237.1 hypothetical protein [Cyanobium sp. La Preciosa 7G6]MCP9937127.1 hypothetical protein [Cyanobium sp. Aljojuca 7A6]